MCCQGLLQADDCVMIRETNKQRKHSGFDSLEATVTCAVMVCATLSGSLSSLYAVKPGFLEYKRIQPPCTEACMHIYKYSA